MKNRAAVYGGLSSLMAVVNVLFFYINRGPNVNLWVDVTVIIVLASAGILFAVASRQWIVMILLLIIHIASLVVAFFLLIGIGIAGPN